MASGEGKIRDWLVHCKKAVEPGAWWGPPVGDRVDSVFEAEVIAALGSAGVKAISQYPSCGYSIDVVVERDGMRVAVECDGEIWHLDEHGQLLREDLDRQEILERAGWNVVRIP